MKKFIRTKINSIILIVLLFITELSLAKDNDNTQYYAQFYRIFEQISKEYVLNPDKQKMIDAAIYGMVSALDPHSTYFTDDDLKEFKDQTKGEFGGIGVEVIFDPNYNAIKVIAPMDDLPAYKAGIKSNDYIIAVDNDFISDLGFHKAIKKMRGVPGTKVKLTIVREERLKPIDMEIVRENVKVKAVKYNFDNNIGYVRIINFNESTTSELKNAMNKIKENSKNKLIGIILDLRNNAGGLLTEAVSVTGYFLDSGVIVTTKGRNNSNVLSYSANKFVEKAPKVPMVILINGASASAAEIVAGALQDHKYAIILGTKSFGKGSVQTFYQINERSGIKLTTAMYYTPSGHSIQEEGIIPDIIVDQAEVKYANKKDNEKRFFEGSLKNHLKNEKKKNMINNDANTNLKEGNSSQVTEMSKMYKEDYQYSRACDLIQALNLLKH